MYSDGINVYEREKLYEEVWKYPMTEVAETYNVPYSAIRKICKSMNIPVPSKGYWIKKKYGKELTKTPLPKEIDKETVRFFTNHATKEINQANIKIELLSFFDEEGKMKVLEVANSLTINEEKSFCKEVQEYKKVVSEWNKSNPSMGGKATSYAEYKLNHGYKDREWVGIPVLAGVISQESLPRAYRILDCIICGLKQLKYSVNDDMTFNILGERVSFELFEKQNKTKHVITSKEEHELKKYEEDLKRYSWAYQPNIRKYDHAFNGRFTFTTKKSVYIRDTDKVKMEDQLADIFVQLIQQAEIVHIERLAKEEEQRKKEEEEHRHELFIERHNNEVDKLAVLIQEANDYEMAVKIRNYVNYVQESKIQNAKAEWINWAKEKADWYDPTMDKVDDIFGARKQETDAIPAKLKTSSWY